MTKVGKILITRKIKLREYKIPGTITNNYENGFFAIKIDDNVGPFVEGDELIGELKQIILINDSKWNCLMKEPKEYKGKKEKKTARIKMTKNLTR